MLSKKLYAWLVMGLCAMFLFYKYVLQVSPSVMTNQLMQAFHVDGAGLGNLAATFFYSYMIMQLLVGPLLDRYSPSVMAAAAMLCSALGALWFAHASHLAQAEYARAMMGVGAAFATVCYMKMASVWFPPERFAFVGGLLATAAMAGSLGGQVPMSMLINHVGWQQTMHYVGWLGLGLGLLYLLFLRQPNNNTNHVKTSVTWQGFKRLLLKKDNWYLLFYSGLAFSPLAVLGGLWGDPFLSEAYHLTTTQAASLTSAMFVGLAVGAPVLGWLSDRLKERFSMMLFGVLLSLCALISVVYVVGMPTWLVTAELFLFGFGVGGFMLGFAVGRNSNPLRLAATVVALINTGDAVFGAFTEPFVGRLLDAGWHGKILHGVHHFSVANYQHAFLVLPTYLVFATVFLLLLRKRCK